MVKGLGLGFTWREVEHEVVQVPPVCARYQLRHRVAHHGTPHGGGSGERFPCASTRCYESVGHELHPVDDWWVQQLGVGGLLNRQGAWWQVYLLHFAL